MATTQNHSVTKGVAKAAEPQLASTDIVVRLTKYDVEQAHLTDFRKALSAYVFHSLQAAGNIMAEAYAELDKPSQLWVIERWHDQKALVAFQQSSLATAVASLVADALVTPAELLVVQDLEPLAKEDWQRVPAAGDHPLTVMLFVDAKPGTGAEFKKRYHAAMPQIRSEAGVVTYQLTQVQGAADKFITYEKFRSEQALQDHLKLPFYTPRLPIRPLSKGCIS
jgi:quinol monooxygenase YgiN